MQKYLYLYDSTRVGILMGALTIAPNAKAAALSLQDAVRSATTNSPEIQAAEAARTTSEWRKTEAFAGYLPQLGLTGNYLLTKKYVEMTFTPPGSPRRTARRRTPAPGPAPSRRGPGCRCACR